MYTPGLRELTKTIFPHWNDKTPFLKERCHGEVVLSLVQEMRLKFQDKDIKYMFFKIEGSRY